MKLSIIYIVMCLISCNILDDKEIITKEISNDHIKIKWFYYSYFSDGSPEFIVIEKDGVKKEIFRSFVVVANIYLRGQTIIIRTVKPEQGLVYTKNIPKKVFGYNIVFDSTADTKELLSYPK